MRWRLTGRTADEISRLAAANAKRAEPLLEEIIAQPHPILIINDASLYLHRPGRLDDRARSELLAAIEKTMLDQMPGDPGVVRIADTDRDDAGVGRHFGGFVETHVHRRIGETRTGIDPDHAGFWLRQFRYRLTVDLSRRRLIRERRRIARCEPAPCPMTNRTR